MRRRKSTYTVGYGKPPKANQFKPGNQAARRRKGQGTGKALSLPDIIDRALRTKRARHVLGSDTDRRIDDGEVDAPGAPFRGRG